VMKKKHGRSTNYYPPILNITTIRLNDMMMLMPGGSGGFPPKKVSSYDGSQSGRSEGPVSGTSYFLGEDPPGNTMTY
jgi:hypothetical protein